MNIQEYKERLDRHSTEFVERRLKAALEDIKFLESIYMTGGENHHYSEQFHNAAYLERQELCQLTSACYSILRSRKGIGYV